MNFLIYGKMKEKRSYKVNKNKLSFHAVKLNSLCAKEEARKKSIVSYEVRINAIEEADTSNKENITLDPNNFHAKKIGNSAVTLITIVLVYVILNMPRLILNLAEYFLFSTIHDTECLCDQTPVWVSVLARTSHLFLAINSSINFLIYYSIGRKFKDTLGRYRKRRQPKSNFNISFAETEKREMIPLDLLTSRKCNRQRSASLSSLEMPGIDKEHSNIKRQRRVSQ